MTGRIYKISGCESTQIEENISCKERKNLSVSWKTPKIKAKRKQ